MIEFENLTTYNVEITFLENILKSLSKKDVELVLCDDSYIQKLNLQYRQKDTATDVLSFPLQEMPNSPLGTIVISLDKAKLVAKELGHTTMQEIALLFIHGLLHLLGFDHEIDEGQMRNEEERLVKAFELPKSLIVRNS